jgi:hypothetical protein
MPVKGWRAAPRRAPERHVVRVLAADGLGTLAYWPTTLRFENGVRIDSIRWKTYGGRTAVGTGISSDIGPVTIRLRRRRFCADEIAYMESAIDPEGRPNAGFSDIMSPHLWLDTCYPEPEG